MFRDMKNVEIRSYELMVKNDSAYLPLSKNNFKGAYNDGFQNLNSPSQFSSFTTVKGIYAAGDEFKVKISSSVGSTGQDFAGTLGFDGSNFSISSIQHKGSFYQAGTVTLVIQEKVPPLTVENSAFVDLPIISTNLSNLPSYPGTAVPIFLYQGTFDAGITKDSEAVRSNRFEGTIDTTTGLITITNGGTGFNMDSSVNPIYIGEVGSALSDIGTGSEADQIKISTSILLKFTSNESVFNEHQVQATIAVSPIYTWPRAGSHTIDTSYFDLDIHQRNIKSIQVVSFQILRNETVPLLKPEFIRISNQQCLVPHLYKTSSGVMKNGIVAALNASDVFQKQYGDLSFPISVHPQSMVRQLSIQLLEANGQSFNLAANLAYGTGSKAFQALITLKIIYQDR